MRRRASHAVNAGIVVDTVDIPPGLTVDIEVSAARVHALHGTEAAARYRHFFSRALAALANSNLAGESSQGLQLSLGALAAWRAGTVEIRTDALRRLSAHIDSAHVDNAHPDTAHVHNALPEGPALAAALGLDPADLAAFVAAQQRSIFGWPPFGAGEHVVAFLGGFAGLDGPWIAPPTAVAAGDEPGTFHLRAGDELWRADCDIFGTRLVRIDEHTGPDAAAKGPVLPEIAGAQEHGELTSRLVTSQYNYLAVLTATGGEDRDPAPAVPSVPPAAVA